MEICRSWGGPMVGYIPRKVSGVKAVYRWKCIGVWYATIFRVHY